MSVFDGIDTRAAEKAYAVANTPYSLLRRLQADSVVHEIRSRADAPALLAELKTEVAKEPKQLSEVVRPYLLLVALSNDRRLLEEAAALKAPHSRWYGHIAPVLVQGFRSASTTRFLLPGEIRPVDPARFRTSIPSSTSTFELNKR